MKYGFGFCASRLWPVAAILLCGFFVGEERSEASERRFTYTYQSGVLGAGEVEIEPWTTWRSGREEYYSRFDNRLEFEYGVTNRLQWAWYFNTSAIARDVDPLAEAEEEAEEGEGEAADAAASADATLVRESEYEFEGVSWEWKYKFTDPVADALGFALYGEATGAPKEAEVEAKIIVDKQIGNVLLAANAVGEYEWEFEEKEETVEEVKAEFDLGCAWLFSPAFSLGVEGRSHTTLVKAADEWERESTAFFVGPTFSYAQEGWWSAFTVLPQVDAIKNEDDESDETLDLHEHERVEVRILFGIHL